MGQSTPVASPSQPRFLIGRDRDGFWIVRDESGLIGGLFVTEAAARHFAEFESDHRPGAVIAARGLLSLSGPVRLAA